MFKCFIALCTSKRRGAGGAAVVAASLFFKKARKGHERVVHFVESSI